MKTRILITCMLAALFISPEMHGQKSMDTIIEQQMATLVSTYKMLHASPELSTAEAKTSAYLAKELRALGFTVTDHVGKYQRADWTGYGVVAVLQNGKGPTVLVRTDMDALPVEEKTGLPYASTIHARTESGLDVGVMHACGHDIHMTSFLGTASVLVQLKDQWQGTLVMVAQPSEEIGSGARAMLDDGLYTRFPKPDYAIALHDDSFEAGKVGFYPGYIFASATTVDIRLRGIGAHGSRPEIAKDPVVLAAQVILGLQTIVSREISPFDPAVITIGSIHGGTKGNIIPDEVKLQLTVRAYKEEVRQQLLKAIDRITKGIAVAAGIPDELAPVITFSEDFVPATYNDPALTLRVGNALKKALGSDNVLERSPLMATEDFGLYGLEGHQIPTFLFFLGASDPLQLAKCKLENTHIPSLHSPMFAPLPEPTLRTGIKAMSSAVLELMKKNK